MPYSSKEGKYTIVSWVEEKKHTINTVLDVGVGSGTYKHWLAEKRKILRHATWLGVEVWDPYIKEFNLEERYSKIFKTDIRQLDWSNIGAVDLTIVGDVLEHISKEDAIALVNNILKFSNFCIISIPVVHYPQDEVYNNPYEKHIKDDWSHVEMTNTFSSFIKKFEIGNEIGVYWLSL